MPFLIYLSPLAFSTHLGEGMIKIAGITLA
jgi:hypothetical protein